MGELLVSGPGANARSASARRSSQAIREQGRCLAPVLAVDLRVLGDSGSNAVASPRPGSARRRWSSDISATRRKAVPGRQHQPFQRSPLRTCTRFRDRIAVARPRQNGHNRRGGIPSAWSGSPRGAVMPVLRPSSRVRRRRRSASGGARTPLVSCFRAVWHFLWVEAVPGDSLVGGRICTGCSVRNADDDTERIRRYPRDPLGFEGCRLTENRTAWRVGSVHHAQHRLEADHLQRWQTHTRSWRPFRV